MAGLLNLVIDSLEVETLNKEEAEQALFYVDFLIDHDGDIAELIHLFNLKEKLLQHMAALDTMVISLL